MDEKDIIHSKCPIHRECDMKYYCRVDRKYFCFECVYENHLDHISDVLEVEAIHNKIRTIRENIKK